MATLDELIRRAQADTDDGREAFSEIVPRFADMAVACAYTILRDREAARDVAQEAFVSAWRALDTLREPKAFPAWFRRIVVNQCHRLTARKRVPTVDLDFAVDTPSDAPTPHAATERDEVRARVVAALRGLHRDQHAVAVLYHFGDRSYGEIARYLRVPVTTVEHRLRVARREMRKTLTVPQHGPTVAPDERGDAVDINARLVDAIIAGDAAKVDELLDLGADPYAVTSTHPDAEKSFGFLPLVKVAIVYDQATCAGRLIARGAHTRVMGWDGLADAEALDHGDIVAAIQERRIKEDAVTLAIVQGHPDWAIQMIEDDPTLVNTHSNWHGNERTPLMHAAEQGSVALVEALLARGADVFAENGATSINALTHAIYHGHDEIADLLRSKGAESEDVTNYLLAARKGNAAMVQRHLDEGVDVNAKDACLRHALPEAFRSGNRALLELLFDRGADPNQSRGWDDYLWLLAHVRKGEIDVVRAMLENGCDPNSAWGGKSLLQMAREHDHEDIDALLVGHGATQ